MVLVVAEETYNSSGTEEPVQPPTRTSQAIQALALNFVRAACKPATTPCLNHWKKPLVNQLALNVDAAFSEDTNTGHVAPSFGTAGAYLLRHLLQSLTTSQMCFLLKLQLL